MVCKPSQNNINIPQPGAGPSLPGLGLPFSVPKIPFPDVSIPSGIPEDIIELIQRIFALFPNSIKFQPSMDALSKGVWDALASLFNQLAPFLAFYKFIQALLNIILCILDVICALLNPFALIGAVIKLFKTCLPDFLSLFPWIALIIMILALVLLLIALIEYIIQIIAAYIEQIIANIQILTDAIQKADAESIMAAVNKLAYLLCLIEQLFSLLLAIAAILAVIKPLLSISGIASCSSSSDCCTDDYCPPFVKGAPDGQVSQTGRLIYLSQISASTEGLPAIFGTLPNIDFSLRHESWQFVDTNPPGFKFLDIITPSPNYGFIYWPDNDIYPASSNLTRVPYTLDMTFKLDPRFFGNPTDSNGPQTFWVKDVIVYQKPTENPMSWNNGTEVTDPVSGALMLVGGLVSSVAADGYHPYYINGSQATLQTLVHRPPSTGAIPAVDDGYSIYNVQYHFKPNHPVLIDKKLITLMCAPDAAAEAAVVGAEYNDLRSALDKVGPLPDVGTLTPDRTDGTGALGCLARALTKFRQNLNVESAAVFQSESTACLNALKKEATDYYCNGVAATADRFTSDLELSPEIQFIDEYIGVTVRLRDKTGTQLGVGVSADIGACLAKLVTSQVTLGLITPFEYDGYGAFTAKLTSKVAGTGELRAYVSKEIFSKIINRDNVNEHSQIVDRVLPYEFVDHTSLVYRRDQGDSFKIRFGPPDVAEDGTNG